MLIYIGFTVIWTVCVVCSPALMRRIERHAIARVTRLCQRLGCPDLLQRGIAGLLYLSVIPLGGLWAIFLLLRPLLGLSRSSRNF